MNLKTGYCRTFREGFEHLGEFPVIPFGLACKWCEFGAYYLPEIYTLFPVFHQRNGYGFSHVFSHFKVTGNVNVTWESTQTVQRHIPYSSHCGKKSGFLKNQANRFFTSRFKEKQVKLGNELVLEVKLGWSIIQKLFFLITQ